MGEISEERAGRLLDQLEAALRNADASSIKRDGLTLSFTAGFFRLVPSWNILAQVGSGVLSVETGSAGVVRYRCSCLQLLIVTTIMAVLAGLFEQDIAFGVIAFFWLFGGNAVIALVRLPGFFRRAVGASK